MVTFLGREVFGRGDSVPKEEEFVVLCARGGHCSKCRSATVVSPPVVGVLAYTVDTATWSFVMLPCTEQGGFGNSVNTDNYKTNALPFPSLFAPFLYQITTAKTTTTMTVTRHTKRKAAKVARTDTMELLTVEKERNLTDSTLS